MIKNYLTTAIRIILRQKSYSFITIFGLALGLASSLLIFIFILDELSYDEFSPDVNRIYRIGAEENIQGHDNRYVSAGYPLAPAAQSEIPEITETVRFDQSHDYPMRYEQKAFSESDVLRADSNFFTFFNYRLLEGDPGSCLNGPHKIVISADVARRYFNYTGKNDPSPIGKFILEGMSRIPVEVTGIAENVPHNSHIKFDMVLSEDTKPRWDEVFWSNYGAYTYIKINDPSNVGVVVSKLDRFVIRNLKPEIERLYGTKMQNFRRGGDNLRFFVQPLKSIHLHSHFRAELEANSDIKYVYIFGSIAILVIFMACINFMNLATARATTRAKEVGIRKTVGALKSRIAAQFMIEAFLYTLCAVVLAIGIIASVMQPFNQLIGRELDPGALAHPLILSAIAVFVIVVGLVAGSYPAFYLSGFQPVSVLKGSRSSEVGGKTFRNGLVIFQFAISIGLIVSTLFMSDQLQFILKRDLGFQSDNILKIKQLGGLDHSREPFKNELLQYPGVISMSAAIELPPNISYDALVKADGSDNLINTNVLAADEDLLKTIGLQLIKGRYFSREIISDSDAMVINETLAREIGYSEFDGKELQIEQTKYHVIGIIKDFNFLNLHKSVSPVVIRSKHFFGNIMAVRLKDGDINDRIKTIESIWKKYADGTPFVYSFMDDDFDKAFQNEKKSGDILLVLTVLSVIIASMGLFGLAAYTTAQRAPEIGIRKVLGASAFQLMLLLVKEFLVFILIAFIVAIPVSWYLMGQWVTAFAYQKKFDPWIVLISGALVILIALLTTGYRSFAAARQNPVLAIKAKG